MAEPFVGEIRMFGGNFAPTGWALCNGQLMPIDQNEALYTLIGTTYGGDGVTTFALPNLQSRIPHHQSASMVLGQVAGEEQVTLLSNQMPVHSHSVVASSAAASSNTPVGNRWASWSDNPYVSDTPNAQLDPASVSVSGGSQPHDNMPPFLVVNFIIALLGIFPTQN